MTTATATMMTTTRAMQIVRDFYGADRVTFYRHKLSREVLAIVPSNDPARGSTDEKVLTTLASNIEAFKRMITR
jgi:hypothetical protein